MSASANFYTCGRIMETLQIDSVTSEGDTTANPIENAFDYNLDTHWYPSSTASQVIAVDLNNDLEEMITASDDREFSDASTNWSNDDMATFSIAGGSLYIVGDATSQTCTLSAAGLSGLKEGRTYRLEYDCGETGASFAFQQEGSGGSIGTMVDGTNQAIDFTATRSSNGLVIASNTGSAGASCDNFSMRNVTDEADYEVDGFAVFIRNYDTYFGDSAGLLVEYSDDGTNWTTFADKLLETEMTNAVGDPLRIYINATSQKRRYWRFTFHDMVDAIEVGQLFLLRTRNVSVGNAWPENDADQFRNKFTRGKAGSSPMTIQRGRRPIRTISRTWNYIGQTNLDEITGALSDSFGSLRPVIYNEGGSYRVVQFLQDEVNERETDYLLFSPVVNMQELPYIEDGRVF